MVNKVIIREGKTMEMKREIGTIWEDS